MKVSLDIRNLENDVLFALIDHFAYSMSKIDNYNQLTDQEKYIISEDTWNNITYNEV